MPLTDTHIRSLKPDLRPVSISTSLKDARERREAYVVQRHRPVRL